MTDRSDDIISSDDDGRRPRRPATRRGRAGRRRWLPAPALVTVMSTALAMVLAGDVTTAAVRLASGGSTAGPESLIPASAFGVVVADLRISQDQVGAFASHFPGSPTIGASSPVDALLKAAMQADSPGLDYDRDLRSWLGDRIAFAGWIDAGKPQTEVVLECTDPAAARTGIPRLDAASGGAPTHYVIKDGYVVIGETDSAVHDALAAAAEHSLADNGSWASDVGGLRDGAAVTGWVNGPAAAGLLQHAFAGMPAGIPGLSDSLAALEKSRVAAGLYVGDNSVELDERAIGAPAQPTVPSSLVTALPDGTIAAFALADTNGAIEGAMQGVRAAMSLGAASSGLETCLAKPMPAMRAPMHMRVGSRRFRRMIRRERLRVTRSGVHCRTRPAAPPPDPLRQIAAVTGLQLPTDARTLLGTGAVAAYGGLQLGSLPDLALRTEPGDLAAARSVAESARSRILDKYGVDLGIQTAGRDLVVASSDSYAAQVAAGGHLGGTAAFTTSMGELPTRVSVAGFVDLSRIWPMVGVAGSGPSHLQSVGFWSGQEGDVAVSQLRVLVG